MEKRVKELEGQVQTLLTEIDRINGQLNEMSSNISLKVSIDGVISAINLSTEGVRIAGEKIQVDRETLIEDNTLEGKGLSISVTLDGKKVAETIEKEVSDNLFPNLEKKLRDLEPNNNKETSVSFQEIKNND